MSNASLLLGAGGLVIGVLAGVAFSRSDSPADLRKVIDDTVVPAQEAAEKAAKAHEEQLAALQKRLDALETGLAENAPDMTALTTGLSKEMTAKLDDLRTKLGDDIAKTSAAQAETIKASLADLSKGIEKTTRVAAAAVAATATEWVLTGRLAMSGMAGLAEMVDPVEFLRDLVERGLRSEIFKGDHAPA